MRSSGGGAAVVSRHVCGRKRVGGVQTAGPDIGRVPARHAERGPRAYVMAGYEIRAREQDGSHRHDSNIPSR